MFPDHSSISSPLVRRLVCRRVVDCIATGEHLPSHSYWRLLTDLPRLDDGPLKALHVQADRSQCRKEDDGLQTDLLPFIVLGLRSPVQERHDVLGHLRSSGGGT